MPLLDTQTNGIIFDSWQSNFQGCHQEIVLAQNLVTFAQGSSRQILLPQVGDNGHYVSDKN